MLIKRKLYPILFILLGINYQSLYAQLGIDTSMSIQQMVQEVLLDNNSYLLIKNIKYKGSQKSIGTFVDESDCILPSGLILSTGDVFDAIGPNKSRATGSLSSRETDQDLQAIATGVVSDAAVLEFDLLTLRDSLEFTYVFASEEYPEYVDRGVNDVFGFFISKKDVPTVQNLAKLNNGTTVVSIDNINHLRNEEYYLPSDRFHTQSLDYWQKNPEMALRARTYEYDGFTTPLTSKVKLLEGQWYHFKIAIGDVGDRYYDSAVLIKAKSFASKGDKIPKANEIIKTHIQEYLGKEQEFSLNQEGRITFDLSIEFNTNEATIQPNSYNDITQLANILNSFPSLKVNIIGHTDNIGKAADNHKLSKSRAIAVRNHLIQKGIDKNRILFSAKGDTQPKTSNTTEKGRKQNRRVEFELIY